MDERLASERFACDLTACKGACCTLPGGRGAPLEDSEVSELEQAYPVVKQYLSRRHLDVIANDGMFEGYPGHYATTCVDDKDCVFVYYDDGIARCAIERAHTEGLISWRKPLSCHLFPARVSANGSTRIRYESIPQCDHARVNGQTANVPLYDFLKDALVRKFGEAWYDDFRRECIRRERSS